MAGPPILQQGTDLTPQRMADLLRANGALTGGDVEFIAWSDDAFNKGFVANIARGALTYSLGASRDLPASIFLKMSKPDVHPELLKAGAHEVAFYRAMSTDSTVPLPVVYSAEADDAGRTHIVMQDLSDTHFQKPLPIPPSVEHCMAIATALAKLHAHWWNSPRLGRDLGSAYTREANEASDARLRASFPDFAGYLGDALLPRQRAAYEAILASSFLERLGDRLVAQDNVSLVHGDMHTGNVMLPRGETGDVVLIDWHRWAIDLPTFDLAFLIALHWSPERRAALEVPLLRHYHETMLAHGVTGYSWQQCWDDYRTEVIICMLIPIGQHRRGSPAGTIWFGLQDASAAVDDLDCLELL